MMGSWPGVTLPGLAKVLLLAVGFLHRVGFTSKFDRQSLLLSVRGSARRHERDRWLDCIAHFSLSLSLLSFPFIYLHSAGRQREGFTLFQDGTQTIDCTSLFFCVIIVIIICFYSRVHFLLYFFVCLYFFCCTSPSVGFFLLSLAIRTVVYKPPMESFNCSFFFIVWYFAVVVVVFAGLTILSRGMIHF